MINITLTKEKYRNRNRKMMRSGDFITYLFTSESHTYSGRTGNCGGQPTPKRSKSPAGKGVRKRQYGPF